MTSMRFVALAVVALIALCQNALAEDKRRNVLLMIIDDLRPELGLYQKPNNVLRFNSPNLNEFARTSLVFDRSYADYGSCNPSRNSMLTGVRPENLGLTSKDPLYTTTLYKQEFKKTLFTLPLKFNNLGYHTAGIGKIFHQERASDFVSYRHVNDQNSGFCPGKLLYCTADPSQLVDKTVADFGVTFLSQQDENSSKPFLLILGFHRPHVAYSVPTWAFDSTDRAALASAMRDPNSGDWIDKNGIAANFNLPSAKNMLPALSSKNSADRTGLSLDDAVKERLWYAAAVQWMDYSVGRVLYALNSSYVANSTMVIVWGDNGVELGEYGARGKSTPFETSSRVPLLVRVPWMSNTFGKRTKSIFTAGHLGTTMMHLLVHNGDSIAPESLASFTSSDLTLGDGISQVPLFEYLNTPRGDGDLPNEENYCFRCFSVTTNSRCYGGGGSIVACETQNRDDRPDDPPFLIFSLRTPKHRYMEFRQTIARMQPDWTNAGLKGRAIFSHVADDGQVGLDNSAFERTNAAPCASCPNAQRSIVVINEIKIPLLPNDVGTDMDYFPPELDTLDIGLAETVVQYSWFMRSYIRDKVELCSGHGLPRRDGGCDCFSPWYGPLCDVAAGNIFPRVITRSPTPMPTDPTSAPTPPTASMRLSVPCSRTWGAFSACASFVLPCSSGQSVEYTTAVKMCADQDRRMCAKAELMLPKSKKGRARVRKQRSGTPGYACDDSLDSVATPRWFWTSTPCRRNRAAGHITVSSNAAKAFCAISKNYIPRADVMCCEF